MGTIKDLVDLVTQLSDSVKDRKFASELRQIQSMIGSIQSEHAAIHEQRIELMSENAELKQTISSLHQEITLLKQEIIDLQNKKPEPGDKLPEEAEKILVFFTKYSDVTVDHIAHHLSFDLTKTEYWLDLLSDKNMVYASHSVMSPTSYSISPEGRKFLVINNLI